MQPIDRYTTLIQPIRQRARQNPESVAIVFVHDDGSEEKIRAAQLDAEAARYALALQACGVQPDELVILVLRHSQTLLFAFWGALYLGAIASIFPFLTEKLDPQIYMERVKELVTHSKARAVITFPEFKAELSALLVEAGCAVLSTADVTQSEAGETHNMEGRAKPVSPAKRVSPAKLVSPIYSAEKIAFLQHSSGTTGLQKGVALSHRSALNQIEAYSRSIELSDDDVIVSWLPLYHDMGLIAGFVMPLVVGTPLVLMSPFKWVRDPKVLLHAIQRHRGTLCWLPNFAYNHSARAIRAQDLAGLDLSSMRAFINCSEPCYDDSHQAFLTRFAACGVRKEALSTCYAMAENTFAVTQHPTGRAARLDWVDTRALQEKRQAKPAFAGASGATALVSCGVPIAGTEICIMDEGETGFANDQPAPERCVGEIALRGNCMLSGYYQRPDLTALNIRAGWYYTGDMGYVAEGELFVTGRKKDLIIVGGKNIYPQDLEAIANYTPGITPGRSVAFGVFDKKLGSENIVMVCELEEKGNSEATNKAIEMDLRRRVVQRSEIALADVRLVEGRWLIKTSSGKISRSANRDKYLKDF